MKRIVITFNDDTDQEDIDGTTDMLTQLFDNHGITAVIVYEDVEISNEQA